MIIVLYLFFLILMLDVVRFIDRLAKFIPPAFKNHHFTPYSLAAAVFLLATVPVAYGSWNAQHPVVKKYNVHVNKDAGEMKQLRIAMVSDIHYGPVIDTDRLKTLQQMIHQIKPDLVLLAGDITNGPLPPGKTGNWPLRWEISRHRMASMPFPETMTAILPNGEAN